jgi:hypothetical protein
MPLSRPVSLAGLVGGCRNGWHRQFLEADLQTPLLRKLHFASADKVIELVERGVILAF